MKILRLTLRLAAISAALAVGTTQLAAQTTTGSIGGRVLNAAGQGVDNAQIQVVNGETGMSVGANTRTDGNFVIVGLETGTQYRVTVRRIGFAPQTIQPVRVSLGQTTPINFTLNAQAATLAAVTVEAAAEGAIIAPSQKGTSTTISDTLLRKLPTLNRNFTDFVSMTPQVSTSGPGLSAGGANNRYNNIQIDGATEKDLFGLGSTGQPGGQAGGKSIGLEAVKEFQVLLAPYDVRVGNFAGLTVNAVTKSGTNDFHGSAYVYQRNDDLQRKETYLGNFYTTQYGFGLGGPILKDKVFFYVNPEFQKKAVPASGLFIGDGNALTQPTAVTTAIDQFKTSLGTYGLHDLGDGGKINNNNPLSNVFARIDVALPYNSTLVLRDNYAHADQQVFSRAPAGSGTLLFPLTDNLYEFTSEKNAPVAQLRTNFTNGSYNEVIAAYTRIRDKRGTPGTLQPQIDLFNGNFQYRTGTEASSQANALDQDILELTDNYTIPIGSSHRLTVGASGQWYKVRNLFGANSAGYWIFGTLDSLAAGRPRQYQVSVPVAGDGAVRFKSGQFAGYLQDDYTITPHFNVSLGVRFDNPVFFDKPPQNDSILKYFNRNTSDVPTSNLQVSPRFGFNWNVTGDDKNQLRGGLGIFQGSPAYVWLSNSFQNSGGVSGFASLNCNTPARSPQFTATAVATPPSQCADGTRAAAGAEADLLRKDLKFPQTMRGNLGFDHDLGHGYVVGVEGLYTHFLNSLFYTNIALQDTVLSARGTDGRSLYGTVAGAPLLKVAGRTAVYDVQNESKDYSYSLTGRIEKRFTTNFGGSLAYTYTQAYDIQSLTSSTAGSQWGFGRQISGSQNDLNLSHSAFETPHRIVGGGSYTLHSGTSLSVTYTGQSGLNFDYVSSGDVNGDGRTGNDLLYVPTGLDDPKFPSLAAAGATVVDPAMKSAFNDFISRTDCLNSQRGTIMTRNSCRTPWTNEFDVAIEQGVQPLLRALNVSPGVVHGQDISIRLDIINFGNLLNKNWGRQISASNFNPVQIYTQRGIALPGTVTTTTSQVNLTNGVPLATFNSAFDPFSYTNVFSNYGMQVSLRYAF
ncbi:MAG TPA: carboxypeptidase regulatory-like domain-containing protein [Gemmatimonadaceae bacterium]